MKILTPYFIFLLIQGCILNPSIHKNYSSVDSGFKHRIIKSGKTSERLYLYFDGDGIPWENNKIISNNPTPRHSQTIKLVNLSPVYSIYIGRPCYWVLPMDENCHPKLWTSGRYSETIINNMIIAIEKVLPKQASNITLVGYSGGGVIATLIAEELPQVTSVITIASNLDTDLWTKHHGYLPLKSSINPTALKKLRNDIKRTHLIGLKDQNVPVFITQSFVDKHGGEIIEFPSFDHQCCWETIWEAFITEFDELNKSTSSNQ